MVEAARFKPRAIARGLNPNSSFAWIIARSSQLRCV
jgi:hypothetical protein